MARRSVSARDPEEFDDDAADESDEGPSADDLERFSGDEARCPECGASIWDDAPICPRCGAVLGGDTLARTPLDAWWRRRWIAVVIVVLVLAMLGLLPMLLRPTP